MLADITTLTIYALLLIFVY